MVINPTMQLPDGYVAVDLSTKTWKSTTTAAGLKYFNLDNARFGYDVSTIDPDSVRCGRYKYVGLLASGDMTQDMDMELSLYANLQGVRIIHKLYGTTVSSFTNALGDNCWMIFKLLQ